MLKKSMPHPLQKKGKTSTVSTNLTMWVKFLRDPKYSDWSDLVQRCKTPYPETSGFKPQQEHGQILR